MTAECPGYESGCRALQRKNLNKGDVVDNLRYLTLLNAGYKFLTRVLVTVLTLVVARLVSDVQTCAIPSKSIHDILHFIRYIIERLEKNLAWVGPYSIWIN